MSIHPFLFFSKSRSDETKLSVKHINYCSVLLVGNLTMQNLVQNFHPIDATNSEMNTTTERLLEEDF
jgi:hypothetical protein